MEVSGRKHSEIKEASGVELLCEPCLDIGQKLLAVGFCVDCNDFLCSQCYKHHHKPKVYRDHVLLDVNAMPKVKPEKTSTAFADNADRCSKHKGEIIKFYCRSDRQLGCGSCMITSHRRCEELISIEEEYKKIDNENTKLNIELDSQFKTKEQNSIKIETNHSQAVKDIKQFLTDIKVLFESLEDKMITEADKIKEYDEKKIKYISITCLRLRNDIFSLTSDLAKLHQTQHNRQLFTMMEEAKERMTTISKDIDQTKSENKVQVYSFVPEKQLKEMMDNFKALGKLDIKIENATKIQNTSIEDIKIEDAEVNQIQTITKPSQIMPGKSKTEPTKQIKPFKHRQIINIANINVKSSKEANKPFVTGLTLLPDDRLILTDLSNIKVKLVSATQGNLISERKLSSRPHDITAIDDNQVAMTMPYNNQIQMLSISNQNISLNQTIQVKGRCYGIIHNDGILIVTFDDPAKIELISMNGEVFRAIDKGTNRKLLFKHPKYVAFSLDKIYVYISDNANHSVICITLDGVVKGIYKDEGLQHPHGLTVDKTGLVYVVGGQNDSSYIYQISADCSQGQKLNGPEQGLWCPWSLAYCHKEDKLYVGNFHNKIIVSQLK